MNILYFIGLCAVNFISLVIVSVCIMYYVKKKETVAREASVHVLQQEEGRLKSVLDEISSVATSLYSELEEQEKKMRYVINEANKKIEIIKALQATAPDVKQRFVKNKVSSLTSPKVEKKLTQHVPQKHCQETIIERVYNLADRGFSIVDIAKMVDKPNGEVSLILNLRNVIEPVS